MKIIVKNILVLATLLSAFHCASHKDIDTFNPSAINSYNIPVVEQGDTMPYIYMKDKGVLMICGISKGDDGRFYIAGGNPLQVACYDADKGWVDCQTLADETVNLNLFSLRGDTVYVIDDHNATLYKVNAHNLSQFEQVDLGSIQIDGCLFRDSDFVAYHRVKSLEGADTVLFAIREACIFSYDGRLQQSGLVRSDDPMFDNEAIVDSVKGEFRGHTVCWNVRNEELVLSLCDKEGRVVSEYAIPNGMFQEEEYISPLQVLSINQDDYVYCSSPSTDFLSGDKFYTTRWNPNTEQLIITEIDLSIAFENHMK